MCRCRRNPEPNGREDVPVPHRTQDKQRIIRYAKASGRGVLWMDDKGYWHAATDLNNTPHWAAEIEVL